MAASEVLRMAYAGDSLCSGFPPFRFCQPPDAVLAASPRHGGPVTVITKTSLTRQRRGVRRQIPGLIRWISCEAFRRAEAPTSGFLQVGCYHTW
jgi:hypothetical protein